MKKPILNILVVIAVSPLLVQCATQSDIEQLQRQLHSVNKKLDNMQSTTVDKLQKRQALASGQVEQLEQDIMKLRGQLDETYYLNQRLREQNKELEQSISNVAQLEAAKREETLHKLERLELEKEAQVNELNQSIKAIQEARIKDAERKAKEAAIAAQLAQDRTKAANKAVQAKGGIRHIRLTKKKVKRSVVAPPRAVPKSTTASRVTEKTSPVVSKKSYPKSSSPAAPVASGAPSLDDYNKAQQLYKQQKYAQAYQIFENVAAQSTSNKNVDARYMMGECLFAQKDYDKAIMQFQKIISQHSDHSKAPSAMLKQGMAFEKLSDKDTAKVIYKKLLKKHGSTPQAAEAQAKLNNL